VTQARVDEQVSAYHFSGQSINDYYPLLCEKLMVYGDSASPRGLETRELHPTTVHVYNPRRRLITSHGRMMNLPFALAEAVQIIGGLNDPQMLKHYNSQIIKIQGDPPVGWTDEFRAWEDQVTRFNAGYGERLRRFEIGRRIHDNTPIVVDQLWGVIQTLHADPDSRQANIVISHPGYDSFVQETKDRACNVYAHVMIRDGKLDWTHVIRSNDVVWGLPYNFVQWLHVMEWVATTLHVPLGKFFLMQDSLHVYADKYIECTNIRPFDMYEYIEEPLLGMDILLGLSHDNWFKENVIAYEDWIRTGGPMALDPGPESNYWFQVVKVFNSYAAFKQKRDQKAFELMPDYPELRWPLMRNYVVWRWGKENAETKLSALHGDVYTELRQAGIEGKDVAQWLA
jgi:thymidylate synthase